jgi:hypothetical protein
MKICLSVKRIFRVSPDMITVATGADTLGDNGRIRVNGPRIKPNPKDGSLVQRRKKDIEVKSEGTRARLLHSVRSFDFSHIRWLENRFDGSK